MDTHNIIKLGTSSGVLLLGVLLMLATRPSTARPLVFDSNYDPKFIMKGGAEAQAITGAIY